MRLKSEANGRFAQFAEGSSLPPIELSSSRGHFRATEFFNYTRARARMRPSTGEREINNKWIGLLERENRARGEGVC